jgi:hypothetical protein
MEIVVAKDLLAYRREIIDQNGYSSCAVCSGANGLSFQRVKAGRPFRKLDWLKAYQEICGAHGGVPIDTVLDYAASKGYPLVGRQDRLKLVEAADLHTINSFWTAAAEGHPIVFGWHFPAGAHAECAIGVKNEGGKLFFPTQNSHGLHCSCCQVCSQAVDGVYAIDEQSIAQGIVAFGAFAVIETAPLEDDPKLKDAARMDPLQTANNKLDEDPFELDL